MFVSLDDKEQRILISVSQCPAFVRNVYWIQTSVSLSRRRHQNQGVVGHTTLAQTLNRRQESCQVWIPPFQSQRLFKLISNGNRTRPNTFVLIIPNSSILWDLSHSKWNQFVCYVHGEIMLWEGTGCSSVWWKYSSGNWGLPKGFVCSMTWTGYSQWLWGEGASRGRGEHRRREWDLACGWESLGSSSCLKRKEEGSCLGEQSTPTLWVTWEVQVNAWNGREVTTTRKDQRYESPHLENPLSKQLFISAQSLEEQTEECFAWLCIPVYWGEKKSPLLFCLQFIILMYFLMASLQAEQRCSVELGALLQLHYYLEAAYIHQLKPEENVGSKSKRERELIV